MTESLCPDGRAHDRVPEVALQVALLLIGAVILFMDCMSHRLHLDDLAALPIIGVGVALVLVAILLHPGDRSHQPYGCSRERLRECLVTLYAVTLVVEFVPAFMVLSHFAPSSLAPIPMSVALGLPFAGAVLATLCWDTVISGVFHRSVLVIAPVVVVLGGITVVRALLAPARPAWVLGAFLGLVVALFAGVMSGVAFRSSPAVPTRSLAWGHIAMASVLLAIAPVWAAR
jgi:hypothetical protein